MIGKWLGSIFGGPVGGFVGSLIGTKIGDIIAKQCCNNKVFYIPLSETVAKAYKELGIQCGTYRDAINHQCQFTSQTLNITLTLTLKNHPEKEV